MILLEVFTTLAGILIAAVLIVTLLLVILHAINKKWTFVSSTRSQFLQETVPIVESLAVLAGLVFVGIQAVQVRKSFEANTVQLMVDAQRDIFGRMLDNPELYQTLTGQTENVNNVFLSMVINHAFNAFTLYEKGFVDPDWWDAMLRDMQNVFQQESMQTWWDAVRSFYPERFQDFVDKQLVDAGENGGEQ